MPDDGFGNQSKPEEYLTTLKLFAARGQLDRNPDFSIQDLMSSLELCAENRSIILYFGANAAYQAGSDLLALERLETNAKMSEGLYRPTKGQ